MTEEFKILLVNYITGNTADTETEQVEQWIEESAVHKQLYIELQEAWNASVFVQEDAKLNVDNAYRLIEARVGLNKKLPILHNFIFVRAAAAVLLLVIASAVFYRVNTFLKNQKASFSQSVYVPAGNKKKIVLSDSSIVWLNSGSTLQVSEGFGVSNRTVYLEGEGYFEVKTNKNLVFTVKTKEYTVRDIGTIFNINTYTADAKFEAAVIEGKISIEGKFSKNKKISKIFLTRNGVVKINMLASQDANTAENAKEIDSMYVKVLKVENLDKYAGWKDNLLVFDEDAFKDISKKLERKYNVTILIQDEKLANYRYSGSFNNMPNIQSVLDILKETTPVNYQIKGDTITIQSKK